MTSAVAALVVLLALVVFISIVFFRMVKGMLMALLVAAILAGLLAYSGRWKQLWPIFGTANQLLAALALLAGCAAPSSATTTNARRWLAE
mgnify:CR=1 FL=1